MSYVQSLPRFTSCCNILLSRFCVWDYKSHHITDIKINRIIQIHNQALRKTLPGQSTQEPSPFSQKYKRCMEYLFYMPEPEHSYERDEILQILENGFKTGNAYKALGRERAVPLSDTTRPSPDFPSSSHTSPTDAPSVSLTERDLDEEALKMGPILKHHPKLLSLDEKSILTVTRTNVLSQITVLNLDGSSLNKLPEIS
ncbi:hypothetical protein cypCar_00015168 [Cyprinus carpio]|nr:hypothetical protein cypCar_00015168 [Cyprinus carpio]